MIRLLTLPVLVITAAIVFLLIVTSSAEGQAGLGSPAVSQANTLKVGLGRASVRATICQVFGPHCGPALRVASCETGGTYNPMARGRAGERGLFQLHPVHFGWLNEARLFEPRYNAWAAYRLSREAGIGRIGRADLEGG